MSSPIVIGIEPQRPQRAPLEFALRLQLATGAPLLLCTVHHAAGHDAESIVAELAAPLRARRVPVDTAVVARAHADAGLADVARVAGAALIVVGRGHRGRFGRVLPGGTIERLLHHTPCPVAVVPAEYRRAGPLRRVAFAYCEAPDADAALDDAVTLARALAVALELVGVREPLADGPLLAAPDGVPSPARPASAEVLRAQLDQAAERAGGLATTRLIDGDAAIALADATDRLDLLIAGGRGRGAIAGALLGSVTQTLARLARCPVILIPADAAGGLARLAANYPAAG